MKKSFDKLDWGLVPGPEHLDGTKNTLSLGDPVARYRPERIATAFLSIPGTTLLANSEGWWDWRARHQSSGGEFEIGFSLFATRPPSWGGSNITACTSPQTLFEFCQSLRARGYAIWLQDAKHGMWSYQAFQDEFIERDARDELAIGGHEG